MAESDGGGFTLPSWIFNLRGLAIQIKDAGGPARWAYQRIVEFLLAAVFGTVTGLADLIASTIGTLEHSFEFAGTSASLAFRDVGRQLLSAVAVVLELIQGAASAAGPFGPILYVILAVALIVLLWRLLRALLDSVPILSGVQTFFEGIL